MELRHFPGFYRSNIKRIYRFVYFRVRGNKDVAEDLTQDIFLKAFAAFETFDPEISESSWLFTIARNHIINHVQKQRLGVCLDEIENTVWDCVVWDDKMADRHDHQRMLEALRQLPKDDQDLVRLKHLEGWSYDDLADMTGKNAGALRVQSHRALKELKNILKQK